MKRNLKDYGLLVLKGMGMGAADVVPGVSGGTIAFIVGIYEELINSIKSINGASLKLFSSGRSQLSGKRSMLISCYPSWQGSGSASSRWQRLSPGFDRPSDTGLVFLLRSGIGFYLVCVQRYQEVGLENNPELYRRDRHSILHYGRNASRDTDQPVLYLPLWSDSHLCNDPAGHIGQFYLGALR